MVMPIVILSLIFVGLAFILTEKNANYLLAGYNTLPEGEKQNFDIAGYLTHFRKFHIFLGISTLIFGLVIYYWIDPDWSGIFLGTYPMLAYVYLIWSGRKYSKALNKKQQRKSKGAMIFMVLVFLAISAMFWYSMSENQIVIHPEVIKIKGDYGMELKVNEIKSIELVDAQPQSTVKTNGFALQTIKKGYFKTKDGEKIKLLLNSAASPVILITTHKGERIYYSAKNKSNQLIFDQLKSETGK